jgi:hypothetical protein
MAARARLRAPSRITTTLRVFAVDADKLPDAQDDNASVALVGSDLHFHTLGRASLTATYGR